MKNYGKRNLEALGSAYTYHLDAMTRENLHRKSDIAAELAYRDLEFSRISQKFNHKKKKLTKANKILSQLRKTKDGVMAYPGMRLWHEHSDDGCMGPNCVIIVGWDKDRWYLEDGGSCNYDMYSTYEAAEQAMKEK